MKIFTPNTVIASADMNLNFSGIDTRVATLEAQVVRHNVGATNEPAYQNGWTNYNAPWNNCFFTKSVDGMVTVNVMTKSGTWGSVIFTLPVGFRPGVQISVPAYSPGGACFADISTTGTINTEGGSNNAYLMFNATFKAEN